MSDSDFTPINVERPDGEVDPFLGRPKHLQLDASNPRDARALAWLLAWLAARGNAGYLFVSETKEAFSE